MKASCQVSTQRERKGRKKVGVEERMSTTPCGPDPILGFRLCERNGELRVGLLRRPSRHFFSAVPGYAEPMDAECAGLGAALVSCAARCLAASCCKVRPWSDACLHPSDACLHARPCPHYSPRVRAREARPAEATSSTSPAPPPPAAASL
jgi:hypothetical protein